MAAAEARAAWQRANRCFVQEDAKRAPKLASRQSSNSSSRQADSGPVNATDHLDHRDIGFMAFNKNHPYSNLPPDAKWWLKMEPNYVHQRGLNTDQLNGRIIDVEPSPTVTMESRAISEDSIDCVNCEVIESFLDIKKHSELTLEEVNLVESKVDQDFLDLKNMTDYYELLEMEIVGGSLSKQSTAFSSCTDSSWVGGEKVPWWRVTDEGELASFVAHKSLLHIENCDLPPPQMTKVRREPCKQASFMGHDEIFAASLDCDAQHEFMSSPSSGGSQGKDWSSLKGELQPDEDATTESLRSSNYDMRGKGRISVNDPGEAKLLEALCHSQTRAREAEKAAKQAYSEKEHVLKLFFRQASQLFAYKQWFKLLQLENLLLQTGNNSSPFTSIPDLLPRIPEKPQKLLKSQQKSSRSKRRKRGSQDNDIGKYAVAFAIGFTLVGAGLILGWTVGWLLPTF